MTEMLTTDEVARWLRVTRYSIYRYLRHGMPHYQLGGRHLFKRIEVEAWMKRCADGGDDGVREISRLHQSALRVTDPHTMTIEESVAKLKAIVP